MSDNRHAALGIHPLPPQEAGRKFKRLHLYNRAQRIGLLVLAVLLAGGAIVVANRVARGKALEQTAGEQAKRYVSVVNPKPASGENMLSLPGTLQGFVEAPIYARANGYVERWYKDIGDPVKKGELLAQISAPEVAQQLLEAQAAQQQAATNAKLAKDTFERWQNLRASNAVSQQEVDERRNTLNVATAAQASTAAAVKRLQEMVGYSKVVAPFDGIVTKRLIDVGTLVDATGNKLLFNLAKIDPLRVYVFVPQSYAPQIKVGNPVEVKLREMPGKTFTGTIARSAGAIDPATRTLQVEISLPNKDGALLPGSYAQVAIKAKGASETMTVPSNTLLFRPDGPKVGIVGEDGKVRLQSVRISRELGNGVELAQGVTPADKLIINPADSLTEGDVVTVVAAKEDNTGKGSAGKDAGGGNNKPAGKQNAS